GSCGDRLKTVLVMKTVQNRFGDDAMAARNLMAIRGWCEPIAGWIGNAGSQARMRAAAIVVTHPVLHHNAQMPFIQDDKPIQAFSTHRADQPLAKRICL